MKKVVVTIMMLFAFIRVDAAINLPKLSVKEAKSLEIYNLHAAEDQQVKSWSENRFNWGTYREITLKNGSSCLFWQHWELLMTDSRVIDDPENLGKSIRVQYYKMTTLKCQNRNNRIVRIVEEPSEHSTRPGRVFYDVWKN